MNNTYGHGKAGSSRAMAALKGVFSIRFVPKPETALALGLAALSVVSSFALALAPGKVSSIVFRDVLQIGIVGLILPALLMNRGDRLEFGLRFRKWPAPFVAGLILTAFCAAVFYLEDPASLAAGVRAPWSAIIYIMAANIFEIVFFFAFLRGRLERAFGIIPAILIAATAYSLHHAGFQPEFGKLFIVGLAFMTIYRIAGHWLVMFPLWWLCALWDVLFQAEKIGDIDAIGPLRPVLVLAFIAAATVIAARKGVAQARKGFQS